MRVALFAIIVVTAILVGYFMSMPDEKPLKIYNPVDVKPEMVDRDLVRMGFGHTIAPFKFTDQNGNTFSSKSLKNKIYVAEYFFTTCGTICPKMNLQMQRVQEAFAGNSKVNILSFTVDPETDTVAQIKNYAESHGANDKQWHFLTGKKEDLYALARKSFFVLKPAAAQNQGDVGSDFIHTNNFVLIDGKSRIRGYYDGTSEHEVSSLIHDMKQLLATESE